jgi:FHS family glucose/mannose:H+ symporter-like MFS transporter
VSVYSTVGLVARDDREHAGITNTLEGVFMVGVLSAYWLFGLFIDSADPKSTGWLNVYWLLSGLCAVTFLLVLATPIDERGAAAPEAGRPAAEFLAMLRLFLRPLVSVFILTAFLYVLVEQAIGTWLPTFNNEILKLPAAMSVQVTGIYAGCLAFGRLAAGVVMRRFHWFPVLAVCILGMGATVLFALPLTRNIVPDPGVGWSTAPVAAFLFPLIGLFMAPVYPGINSVMLSSLPRHQHASMTGLLVIFSALGGTTGSLITGYVFGHVNGHFAFYLTLVPIVLMLGTLALFKRQVARAAGKEDTTAIGKDAAPAEVRQRP